MGVAQPKLGDVLDGHDALSVVHEIEQCGEDRRFAAARASRDEDVLAGGHKPLQEFGDLRSAEPTPLKIRPRQRCDAWKSDRHCSSSYGHRWQYCVDTNAVAEVYVTARMQFIEMPAARCNQFGCQAVRGRSGRSPLRHFLQRTTSIDPQSGLIVRALHANISQFGIIDQREQPAQGTSSGNAEVLRARWGQWYWA